MNIRRASKRSPPTWSPSTGLGGRLRLDSPVAFTGMRSLLSGVARQAFKLRAELAERSFALVLDRGGMRRAWLRGRDNLQKRYMIHIRGYNLGLIMRLLTGFGTPRSPGDVGGPFQGPVAPWPGLGPDRAWPLMFTIKCRGEATVSSLR